MPLGSARAFHDRGSSVTFSCTPALDRDRCHREWRADRDPLDAHAAGTVIDILPLQPVHSVGVAVIKGFREFIARGNIIDLAVAVVIGTAFTTLVSATVGDLITPLVAAIAGKHDFSTLTFTVHNSIFNYGSWINALLTFLIVAAVVYYLIVLPMTTYNARRNRNKAATERDCPECLSSIPIAATRCKYCTTVVQPASH
jgi:large conductance mechanosensitive channel